MECDNLSNKSWEIASYAAQIAALHQRGIYIMEWPTNSPDLVLIKNLWSWMKSFEVNYDIQSLGLAELRVAIGAITSDDLKERGKYCILNF